MRVSVDVARLGITALRSLRRGRFPIRALEVREEDLYLWIPYFRHQRITTLCVSYFVMHTEEDFHSVSVQAAELTNLQHLVLKVTSVRRPEVISVRRSENRNVVQSFPSVPKISVVSILRPHAFCALKGSPPKHTGVHLEDCGNSQCTAQRDVLDALSE
jgi:hypothetical protein